MARPHRWRATLDAAVAEACLAVRLYNDPTEPRAFEGFVVHMHMAWLYMLHAQFTRDRIDFRYRDPQHPHRLMRIDGEVKKWELRRCVNERWPEGGAVSTNLDFFIRLRNRFEHRHTSADAALALSVAGHAHAHLVNIEQELTSQFGSEQSLATRLRFPVFVGSFSESGEEALRALQATLPKDLRSFLADYRSGLDPQIADDSRFEFRLRVTMELAPRDPHATAIQFTREADMTEAQRAAVEEMGRKGQVVVRERRRPVYGLDLRRPSDVVREVNGALPVDFHMGHFIKAWQVDGVRPRGGDSHPERTNESYCIYVDLNKNYGYTPAYAKHLIKRCESDRSFAEAIGLRLGESKSKDLEIDTGVGRLRDDGPVQESSGVKPL